MNLKMFHSAKLWEVFESLSTSESGLNEYSIKRLQEEYGLNEIPEAPAPSIYMVFFRQFLSPLIYVLLFAAVVSLLLGHVTDASFIFVVLLLNSAIGTIQEYSAEKSAQALRKITASRALVIRDGETFQVDSKELVPGDVVLLESGDKVPADLRLIQSNNLKVDESILTGESLAVLKNSQIILPEKTLLGDRLNLVYAGTLVERGRASGVVVNTAASTEIGKIASVVESEQNKTPLVLRMEGFIKKVAWAVSAIAVLFGVILFLKGQEFHEILLFSVALSVASIPEGLPVAVTVALAIATRRMAKRNVIVRKLPAVEALGSCTFIATDKTGTLTVNELTVKEIYSPGEAPWQVDGAGLNPVGKIELPSETESPGSASRLRQISESAVLCNEARLFRKSSSSDGVTDSEKTESENHPTEVEWDSHGDAVDVALLVMAKKAQVSDEVTREKFELIDSLPFESEQKFSATLHRFGSEYILNIKGACEVISSMSTTMYSAPSSSMQFSTQSSIQSSVNTPTADSSAGLVHGLVPIDKSMILSAEKSFTEKSYKVIAVASKVLKEKPASIKDVLSDFNFLGLLGITDPVRPDAADAVRAAKRAGIKVSMLTGDHPETAANIGKILSLQEGESDRVMTGSEISEVHTREMEEQISKTRIFARVEPKQKLEIVKSLVNQGEFVAVTGDGANDAPALKAANVGIAMGKAGSDVAKESADLIISDDKFSSIVAGIEEGRIAYANIRKVIYLLISTGIAEIMIFVPSVILDLPMPLTAIQILWMNLVTNGIQDVALAFEPGEGDELSRKPRSPSEPIFDRLMLERVFISSLVMGGVSFFVYWDKLNSGGTVFESRNLILLMMVLFENVMVGNCRSETKSAFLISPFKNLFLLFGTIAAQLIHIGAMHIPWLASILEVEPVSWAQWGRLFVFSISVLIVMEIHKLLMKIRKPGSMKMA